MTDVNTHMTAPLPADWTPLGKRVSGVDGLGKRIQVAMRGESAYAFGRRADVPDSLLRRYVSEAVTPSPDKLVSIAKAGKVDLAWLITGMGRPEGAAVPLLSAEVLESYGLDPGDVFVFAMPDDSMAGTIDKGEWLVIDCRTVSVALGKDIYAFGNPPALQVRRAGLTARGLLLSADNPAAKSETYTDFSKMPGILGRVALVLKRL
jgi:hypothetical protein